MKPFTSDMHTTREGWKKVDYDFDRETIPLRTKYVNPRTLIRQIVPRTYFVIRDLYYKVKYRIRMKENLTRPGIRDFNISEDGERELAEDHISVLRGAAQELERRGAKVIFYIHPYQYTVFHEDYKDLGKVGRELMLDDLDALSLRGYLKDKFSGEPLFIDGCHLTDLGHDYYAEYFYEKIKNELKAHISQKVTE